MLGSAANSQSIANLTDEQRAILNFANGITEDGRKAFLAYLLALGAPGHGKAAPGWSRPESGTVGN